MSFDVDNLFAGMAKAEIFGRGNYLGEGVFKVNMRKMMVNPSKDPDKAGAVFFVTEFDILESTNPDHPVGSTGSYTLKMGAPFTFANITKLVMALLGVPDTKENQNNAAIREEVADIAAAVCGSDKAKAKLGANYEDGMLENIKLKLETKKIATRAKPGKPAGEYTTHTWSPIAAAS